jgi:neural cell adhesion molecule
LNSAVLIKCRVEANPLAEISWFKGDDKNNIFSSNYEQKKEGLRINRVSSSDNDIFWCRADVIETGESKDYPIQVILARMYFKENFRF